MIRRLSRQMPWFRSSSYSPSESSICDDYPTDLTTDEITPRTFGLFRHNTVPENQEEGGPDVTWVVEDFSPDKNVSYLPQTTIGQFISVRTGQQVEVLDCNLPYLPEFCLVRVVSCSGAGQDSTSSPISSSPLEGIVPLYCLRFPSRPAVFSSKSASMEIEGIHMCHSRHNHTHNVNESLDIDISQLKDVSNACNESSPSFTSESSGSTKRRGTFKKWLTNPVRKLSSGKIDKTSNTSHESPKSATKKTSLSVTSWKINSNREDIGSKVSNKTEDTISFNKSSSVSLPTTPSLIAQTSKSLDLNGCATNVTEEDGDVTDVELPPPMKIQAHTYPAVSSLTNNTSNREPPNKRENEKSGELSAEENINNTESNVENDVNNEEICEETDNSTTEESEREKALIKRKFVLEELVTTERDYVRDLGFIVDGYLELFRKAEPEIAVPEDLKNGKDKIIFGNIEAIYEWHRDSFLAEIEKCLEEPERLGLLFRRCERRLNMYVVYCQNKPKSEYIVSEYLDTFFEEIRQKLGHKLQLPDLLIKPVQRIMKYQLLLRDMLKCTEKAGLDKEAEDLRKAVHIMHIVPKAANDMMCVGRLQHFDGKITAQGKLLQQGLLLVGDLGPGFSNTSLNNSNIGSIKMKERQVFLFEQIIIFSETVGQKTQFSNPMYIYKNHLQVNKMSLIDKVDDSDGSHKFLMSSRDPQKEGSFLCQGSSQEERDQWVVNIRAILDTQRDFLRALQSPIAYQKELTKEVSAPELGSLWNPSLRKTLSHPAAVHREKNTKSSAKESLGSTVTSKSMRQTNKKNKTFLTVNNENESFADNESTTADDSSAISISTDVNQSNRKYSCPTAEKPPSNSHKQQSSPSKSKKTFLEGFKNPLRQRKAESNAVSSTESVITSNLLSSHSLDSATGAQTKNKLEAQTKDSSVIRRWSESATPLISPSAQTPQTISNNNNNNENISEGSDITK